MQRKFVAACVLAALGIFVSSCDLIFGNNDKVEPYQNVSGSWIAQADSSFTDSIFNTAIADSTGKLQLVFESDSVLITKKNDSTMMQIKYYQNSSADTIYVIQDSSINAYPITWSADSILMIHHADHTYSFIRK